MPTWKPPTPTHRPFHCSAAWHLRKSGNLLAIYDLVGAVTSGGKTEFFAKLAHVTRYFYPEFTHDMPEQFRSAYHTTLNNFKTLRKLGFLILLPNGHHQWVSHSDWARTHPGKCNECEMLPWQIETDPLVGQLYAAAGGKLRAMEHHIAGLRAYGDTDATILEVFTAGMRRAERSRLAGDYHGTSPKSVLYAVKKELRARHREKMDPAA